MFWQEAKSAAYTPTAEEPATTTQSQRDFGLETTETPETAPEEDTKPERIFPNEMVHHFHPIAWVKQMRLMLGTGIRVGSEEEILNSKTWKR